MRLGMRLRELWKLRLWVGLCVAFSLLVSVWTVMKISLLPPGVAPRNVVMAAATTEVVIDTPQSTLADARADTYNIDSLTNRAVLIGNVMASPPVVADIAKRAHVPAQLLMILPPLTAREPRVLAENGDQRHTTDILKLNDEYRIFVSANPTVPFLRIYAESRDPRSAAALANAAVDSLSRRISQLGASSGTPGAHQVKLMQLGRAKGTVIDSGASKKLALLAFFLTLAFSCATLIFLSRVRAGWRVAALADQPAAN